jgi:uncharacterized membrane protein
MKYIIGYIATGVAFAAIDSVWLRNMYTRLYQPEIGELLMKGGFRMGPAIIFYLLYILGMMIFAVGPALHSGKWQTALLWGAMLGFFCYMTYDSLRHGRVLKNDAVLGLDSWTAIPVSIYHSTPLLHPSMLCPALFRPSVQ